MKEFEKWWVRHNPEGHIESKGFEWDRGVWKAALDWVLNNRKPYYDIDDKKIVATDSDIIYKELEE